MKVEKEVLFIVTIIVISIIFLFRDINDCLIHYCAFSATKAM